ncbi:hypothetical protein [Motilibacter aurantiacus]|uniref:hypothetical protein n=1 Tax=Motilibacter aurantiacus TaxID=2714955 RepID=UPI001409EC59|nr:hypothetical protein [Motilibacter aurantiacus]NHC44916.1 hypothetical protein [Motilibacter aurantiacus]
MDPGDVEGRLRSALAAQQLVRLWRPRLDSHHLQGYVAGLGRRWVLLTVLGPGYEPDGWTAVRRKDVIRVRKAPASELVRRSLELRAMWPPPRPAQPVDLDSRRRLLATAAMAYPLVTIAPEKRWRDVVYIGRPRRITRDGLHLQQVGPDGVWDTEPTVHPLRHITAVQFGGAYENVLLLVAGPAPS